MSYQLLVFWTALLTGIFSSRGRAQSLEELYPRSHAAMEEGRYIDFLLDLGKLPNLYDTIVDSISSDLTKLKSLPLDERKRAFGSLFQLGLTTTNSSLRYEHFLKASAPQLALTDYDSNQVANIMINRTIEHELETMTNMMGDLEYSILKEYPTQKIFLLSPDFSGIYLKLASRGIIDYKRVSYSPITSRIRLLAANKDWAAVRNYLATIGVTASSIMRDGLVVVDPSPTGANGRIVMQAFLPLLTAEEGNLLVDRISVINFGSAATDGMNYREKLREKKMKMTTEELSDLVKRPMQVQGISRYTHLGSAALGSRRSDPATYRPKSISPDLGSTTDKTPLTPVARIRYLLGLAADFASLKTSRGPVRKIKEPWLGEIDAAHTKGRRALQEYEDQQNFSSKSSDMSIEIRETKDPTFPWELYENGKLVVKLKKSLGEGNNVRVFLTERNTAIKILKRTRDARKQLLLVWAYNLMESYGIAAAPIYSVHPQGLYLEMEYLPGGSIESQWGERPEALPPNIKDQVLDHFRKAKKIALERGIWLDLKAANYHVRADGKIVNVDYVPRTNSTYYRFFQDDNGKPFTDARFLDMFLTYDIRKIQEEKKKELARLEAAELADNKLKDSEYKPLERDSEKGSVQKQTKKPDQSIYASASDEKEEVISKSGRTRSKLLKRIDRNYRCKDLYHYGHDVFYF